MDNSERLVRYIELQSVHYHDIGLYVKRRNRFRHARFGGVEDIHLVDFVIVIRHRGYGNRF